MSEYFPTRIRSTGSSASYYVGGSGALFLLFALTLAGTVPFALTLGILGPGAGLLFSLISPDRTGRTWNKRRAARPGFRAQAERSDASHGPISEDEVEVGLAKASEHARILFCDYLEWEGSPALFRSGAPPPWNSRTFSPERVSGRDGAPEGRDHGGVVWGDPVFVGFGVVEVGLGELLGGVVAV